MKELVHKINHEDNFEKAKGMLEMLNTIYGTNYIFLRRRVTERVENSFHDVWANL